MAEASAPNPAPTPAPAPAPAPAPVPAPTAHWSGLTDAADLAYLEVKGWRGPADVVKSYRGAETLIGRSPDQLLVMPRADDPEGFRAVMSKLGLPATSDKYDLGKPAAGEPEFDAEFTGWAKGAFHKAGVPQAMAKAITAEYNAYSKTVLEKATNDAQLAVTADKQTLLNEWGGGHERMMNKASSAANALGFTAEMISGMQRDIGYAGVMKFFAAIGDKIGENKFVSGDGGTQRFSDSLTPAEAQAQWEAAKLDPNFTAALMDKQHPGHKGAQAKQTKLFSIIHGGN